MVVLFLATWSAPTAAAQDRAPRHRIELGSFVDRFFARETKTQRIPGAVFVLVKDGRIVLDRGYGYANLARKTPVSPGHTIFRVCSVSKVLTATAAMQLAERGRLQLRDDVNHYLRLFDLPATYNRPVTMADLLTHTGGFDDRHIGRDTLNPANLRPLGPYLADLMPPRVMPPGRVYSYSDFGYALAGYIVQTISGESFADYVARHIFRPLGMQHSTFRQPLPASLRLHLATGYDVTGARVTPAPFEYFNTVPAAAMSATGTDMARFMIAQLQDGRYGTGRILPPAGIREMQTQHFSSYPHVPHSHFPGVTYGFGDYYWNGQRVLSHSGVLRGFSSELTLLPDRKLGFFVAGTTAHGGYLTDLQRQLIDYLYPPSRRPIRLATPPALRGSLDQFVGSYWSDEYARHTIEKLRQLLNQVTVTADRQGHLTAHFWNGPTTRVTRIAPLLFARVDDHNLTHWAFQRDAAGHIVRMMPGGDEVYERIAPYETTNFQLAFIVAICVIFLSGGIVWLIFPLIRRKRSGPVFLAALAAGLASVLNLAFLVVLLLVMESAASTQDLHYSWLEYGVPPGVVALLCIPLVTTALAITLPVFAAVIWRRRTQPLAARLHYTLLVLAALTFIPFLRYWNLLGFHF
jgi:CubicO group peptidase (beta-lactamase class C family)